MRSPLPACFAISMTIFALGCGGTEPALPGGGEIAELKLNVGMNGGGVDPEQLRHADFSILFVGNSHTAMHDLPTLVGDMIKFRQPGKSVYVHYLSVGFLEDAARSPDHREEIEKRPWKFVVLQAQKISMSGKHEYSRQEGIDLAKSAKARGAKVVFYPEWGMKGVAGDGARQEKVYREMARDAVVGLAPVARAWDLALAARPELALHSGDGNHQSPLGAFLTACVLYGQLTGESPIGLAEFPCAGASKQDRKFLAEIASKTADTEMR